MTPATGLAGRLAAAFLHSKLTPLLIAASTALGLFAVVMLSREEEPQIVVPMVDVFVELPGASPAEVEQRVTRPLEKALWEIRASSTFTRPPARASPQSSSAFSSARTRHAHSSA